MKEIRFPNSKVPLAAACNGVAPLLSPMLTSAPLLISKSAIRK